MSELTVNALIEIGMGMVIIPWCVWVSVSIFGQRQEIALLKQEFRATKEIYHLLKERLQ